MTQAYHPALGRCILLQWSTTDIPNKGTYPCAIVMANDTKNVHVVDAEELTFNLPDEEERGEI